MTQSDLSKPFLDRYLAIAVADSITDILSSFPPNVGLIFAFKTIKLGHLVGLQHPDCDEPLFNVDNSVLTEFLTQNKIIQATDDKNVTFLIKKDFTEKSNVFIFKLTLEHLVLSIDDEVISIELIQKLKTMYRL